ncbi:MAG TPA: hypothetical protein VLA03_08060 [Draconibacterium sp.]|nr:hypothetical protein [Draconibacterium sp.]
MDKLFFKEEQRFNQWWLWFLIIASAFVSIVPVIYGIYSNEVLAKPWGKSNAGTSELIIFLFVEMVIMGGIILLLLKFRLIVEIKSSGLWFRNPPLSRKWKCIRKEEIERFEIRKYKPVAEYGGWGIKGTSRNKAYNRSGNLGLQLYLKNGHKVLFGTQRKQAIEYAMEKMME